MSHGYTKRPQENNALVPLEKDKVEDALLTEWGLGRIDGSTAEKIRCISRILCAKFGKDNSGMVPQGIDIPRLKRVIDYQLDARGGQVNPKDDFAGFINDIMACIKFSQQPPKERKVSLEEEGIHSMEEFQRKYFPNLVGKECPYCGNKKINATEERKGEE